MSAIINHAETLLCLVICGDLIITKFQCFCFFILGMIRLPEKNGETQNKMRKTYASNLNSCGVPLDCIREMMGHNNLNTTLGYIYKIL